VSVRWGAIRRGLAIAGTLVLAIGLLWTLTQPWAVVTHLLFGPPHEPAGWTLYAPLTAARPWQLDPRLATDIEIAASMFFIAAPLLIILRQRIGRGRPFAIDLPMLWIAATVVLAVAGVRQIYVMQHLQRNMVLLDAYDIVFHVHYVLRVCAAFASFAGFYHWFPRITGLRTSTVLGQAHFWLTFIGVLSAAYAPPFALMLYGLHQRYTDFDAGFAVANRISTAGAAVAAAGTLCFAMVIIEALWRRRRVAAA
jgi:cytochrome c oxidase subunit 1